MSRKAIIIGAGPAGLTAALELVRRSDVIPVVLEATPHTGGICRTLRYRGNRMDLGGHRFFSKSERVQDWWQSVMPLQGGHSWRDIGRPLADLQASDEPPHPEWTDKVMLLRERVSRIFFRRRFFDYPVTLNSNTIRGLGFSQMSRIAASYAAARLRPRPEKTLEDFLINRFGRGLYATFFRDYTEKVWGVTPAEIPADWGAQRIRGLSVARVLAHAFRQAAGFGARPTEVSLTDRFAYPKLGPGQFWEEVAREVKAGGGEIRHSCEVTGFKVDGGQVAAVYAKSAAGDEEIAGDLFFSSMPMDSLVAGLADVPHDVRTVAEGLSFRDFLTVGLLCRRLRLSAEHGGESAERIPDHWLYIQEPDVKMGRLQVFNNWSPYMVSDPNRTVWLGLEYFCNEGDELWNLSDEELQALGTKELEQIGLIRRADVLDGCAVRVRRAYPAYFGTYDRLGEVRAFLDSYENLFLIGRNGQHRYNNMDHSMLTAMLAVDHVLTGTPAKGAIWDVNTDDDFHEEG
jgi:protoporphyrinogen oxidase